MSQHDYAIADQAGLSFLADLNALLAAVVSQNSGATEPADTYPYMLWADTASGWIKQRNAGDTAWEMRFPLAAARADVASAATLNLDTATAAWLRITGTTGVTAVTLADGQVRHAVAAGAFTMTYGASLLLQGAANYTTAAGDIIHFYGESGGVVRVEIVPASGQAVVSAAESKVNDFRLTLTTGLPVTTADVTGATTIYACPYKGNQIALYNGSQWVVRNSAQFSLALGTLSSAKPYDVFCYDNAGTPTLEFLVWTNDTTRATALAYQDGILVKSGAATRRYLGTFYTTSTTQTADSKASRYLWNYYHRVRRSLEAVESTASWAYTSATIRQANGSTANQVNAIQGVAEDVVEIDVMCGVSTSSGSPYVGVYIGIDSTTVDSATRSVWSRPFVAAAFGDPSARYVGVPAAGQHTYAWLESGAAGVVFYGTTMGTTGLSGTVMA